MGSPKAAIASGIIGLLSGLFALTITFEIIEDRNRAIGPNADDRSITLLRSYFDAYNSQDVPDIMPHFTSNARLMGVDGDELKIIASGKRNLATVLHNNFNETPSSSSKMKSAVIVGDFVAVVEEAGWESGGEDQQACAMSIYEIQDSSIRQVWYFAAASCD